MLLCPDVPRNKDRNEIRDPEIHLLSEMANDREKQTAYGPGIAVRITSIPIHYVR